MSFKGIECLLKVSHLGAKQESGETARQARDKRDQDIPHTRGYGTVAEIIDGNDGKMRESGESAAESRHEKQIERILAPGRHGRHQHPSKKEPHQQRAQSIDSPCDKTRLECRLKQITAYRADSTAGCHHQQFNQDIHKFAIITNNVIGYPGHQPYGIPLSHTKVINNPPTCKLWFLNTTHGRGKVNLHPLFTCLET